MNSVVPLKQEVPGDIPALLEAIAREIDMTRGMTVLKIGELLIKALPLFKFDRSVGGFQGWCQSRLSMTEQQAYRFINAYKAFRGKGNELVTLSKEAILELAAPSTPKEVREEALERVRDGEKLTAAQIKELKDKIKEKSDKLKEQKELNERLSSHNQDLVSKVYVLEQSTAQLGGDLEELQYQLMQKNEKSAVTITSDGEIIDEYGPLKEWFEQAWSALPEQVRHWARQTVVNRT
jgi:hypothetical protein